MKEDDNNWPEPDRVGRQELEIVMGNEHISFTTSKIGSLMDVQTSNDPEGLRIFYYLVQVCNEFLLLISSAKGQGKSHQLHIVFWFMLLLSLLQILQKLDLHGVFLTLYIYIYI